MQKARIGQHKEPPFFPFSFPASGVRAGGGGGAGDTLLAGETDPYSGSGLKSLSNMPLMSLTRPPPPFCCFLLLLLSSSSSPLPTAEEGESVVGEGREAASGVEWPGAKVKEIPKIYDPEVALYPATPPCSMANSQ